METMPEPGVIGIPACYEGSLKLKKPGFPKNSKDLINQARSNWAPEDNPQVSKINITPWPGD